jgi:hypothetical protein
MNNALPNFLIAGAAKCGTTTFHALLQHHPDVFLCEPKEPHHFTAPEWDTAESGPGDAYVRSRVVGSRDRYLSLFGPGAARAVRGEASTDTFHHAARTIPRIRELLGDPAILLILRNPAERAFSAYMHLRREGRETLPFAEALAREPERIRDGWEFSWHYRDGGFYHERTRLFLDSFSRVKILLFEEAMADPAAAAREILSFLQLDARAALPRAVRLNPSGEPQWPWLRDWLVKPGPVRDRVRDLLPPAWRRRIRSELLRLTSRRTTLDPDIRRELLRGYADDMARLSDLLGRKLPWNP